MSTLEPVIVAWAISWAFEGAGWWQALSPNLKSLAILLISALLGGLAVASSSQI